MGQKIHVGLFTLGFSLLPEIPLFFSFKMVNKIYFLTNLFGVVLNGKREV